MSHEIMTAAQHKAYEEEFYVGVMAKEHDMYTFSFACERCPYNFVHPLRRFWMKGWLDA